VLQQTHVGAARDGGNCHDVPVTLLDHLLHALLQHMGNAEHVDVEQPLHFLRLDHEKVVGGNNAGVMQYDIHRAAEEFQRGVQQRYGVLFPGNVRPASF